MSKQKVAVVTGANKGIGLEIVKGLCKKFDGDVYLTARDVGRGQAAVDTLKKLGLNPKFHQLDLSDAQSITKLKQELVSTYGGLDLLVNNAVIGFVGDNKSSAVEKAENSIKVNYYGTLKVCEILFPILRQNAIVVNLTSGLGHLSFIHSADLRKKLSSSTLTISGLSAIMDQYVKDVEENKHIEKGWPTQPFHEYVVSKVSTSALTVIQQREFDNEQPNRNITVCAVDPGHIATDLNNHTGPGTTEQGAKSTLYAAFNTTDNLKGKYIWSTCQIVPWDSEELPIKF